MAHAIERVIGVHEENAVVWHRSGVCLKRFALALEKHDPTVRLCSAHWNSEPLTGLQVRRARAAADASRTCRGQTAINSLRATQTEFDDGIIFSGQTNARRFGRDETLEIQNVKQSRFQELTLDNRTARSNQRLVREKQRPLGNCINLTGQSQTAQIVEKTRTE